MKPENTISVPSKDALESHLIQVIHGMLDAEIRAAIDDVDRSLVRLALAQTPRDRIRSSSNMMRTLMRLRRARTSVSG
jgi:hypothetical protein